MKRILMNKCECCGSLFEDNVCTYCGARYSFEEDIKPMKRFVNDMDQSIMDEYIIMNLYGKKYKFYVGSIECEPSYIETTSLSNGKHTSYIQGRSPNFRIELISIGEYREE